MTGRPGGQSPANRRRHVRVEVEVRAAFMIVDDFEKTMYHATTVNISHGGACLRVVDRTSEVLAKIGDGLPTIEVTIDVRGDERIADLDGQTGWLKSRLEWVGPPKEKNGPFLMGMEFFEVAKADEEMITTIIADILIHMNHGAADEPKL